MGLLGTGDLHPTIGDTVIGSQVETAQEAFADRTSFGYHDPGARITVYRFITAAANAMRSNRCV
jgi:hypothetical protein